VRFLSSVDRAGVLRFAPLQGGTAARLRERSPEIARDLDSVVFVEHGEVHTRSRALVRVARHLPFPWRLGSWLAIVPRPLADLVYGFIVRIRYRVFGRYERCQPPPPEARARFLP